MRIRLRVTTSDLMSENHCQYKWGMKTTENQLPNSKETCVHLETISNEIEEDSSQIRCSCSCLVRLIKQKRGLSPSSQPAYVCEISLNNGSFSYEPGNISIEYYCCLINSVLYPRRQWHPFILTIRGGSICYGAPNSGHQLLPSDLGCADPIIQMGLLIPWVRKEWLL